MDELTQLTACQDIVLRTMISMLKKNEALTDQQAFALLSMLQNPGLTLKTTQDALKNQ